MNSFDVFVIKGFTVVNAILVKLRPELYPGTTRQLSISTRTTAKLLMSITPFPIFVNLSIPITLCIVCKYKCAYH